jgi:hypothetical protein
VQNQAIKSFDLELQCKLQRENNYFYRAKLEDEEVLRDLSPCEDGDT